MPLPRSLFPRPTPPTLLLSLTPRSATPTPPPCASTGTASPGWRTALTTSACTCACTGGVTSACTCACTGGITSACTCACIGGITSASNARWHRHGLLGLRIGRHLVGLGAAYPGARGLLLRHRLVGGAQSRRRLLPLGVARGGADLRTELAGRVQLAARHPRVGDPRPADSLLRDVHGQAPLGDPHPQAALLRDEGQVPPDRLGHREVERLQVSECAEQHGRAGARHRPFEDRLPPVDLVSLIVGVSAMLQQR